MLDHLVKLQNFENQFLPNALRKFFNAAHPPNERGSYLHTLVEKFSERFCACNPHLGLSQGKGHVKLGLDRVIHTPPTSGLSQGKGHVKLGRDRAIHTPPTSGSESR